MACIVLALGVLLGCPGLGVAQQGEGPAFERCETLTQPVTAGYNELTTFGYNYKVMVEDASDLTSYVFTVRAVTDAHVALNDGSAPFFEIPIGAWRNSRSVIRMAKQGTNLVEHYETLLDSNRFRQFWVSWMDGVVKVGKGCTVGVDEFMRYTHGAPFTVNKISVACIGQLTAYWRIPDYDPVCGTDGSTYSSACEARCKNVRVSSRGECPSRRCVCPQDYDPVCGTDGSTYSNACDARCKNVRVSSRGECPSRRCVCPQDYDPVCGTDGSTYSNACEARCKNVRVSSRGECPSRRCVCPQDYDPVCGTDGSTYSNACEVRCKNVRVSSRGECPSRRCICPQDYDPVCGTDGSTYSNACEARCKNIQVASRGECCVCDPINDPVCGTDGTTYPNECEANCKNVPVQSKGDCSQRRKNCHGTTRFLSCL